MEFLTVEEAANILKLRRETIRRYIAKGYLQAHVLPGGDYRLRNRDIQNLLRCREQDRSDNER